MSTTIYYFQTNFTCILILGLILFSIPKYNYHTQRSVLFNIMLVTAMIYCTSDLVAGVFRGADFFGARFILWTSNILYSSAMILMAFEWVLFCMVLLKGEIGTTLSWIMGGFGCAILLANLITPITGLIFYLDADNLYHRGNYIVLNWIYVYACQFFPIILMTTSDVNPREKRAIILYPVFPLIASVIQILCYGVSAGQVGATVSIILIYVVFQGREINEHRRRHERLELESEMAKEANEAKSRFLASMSHEIRTPINAILGMDTMILRESREDTIRRYAMNIHTASSSLLSLINDILDFSKIESGKMEIEPVQYDFATLVSDVFNMIRIKADAKNLKLLVHVDSALPCGLIGDDVRIRQILLNIMGNAVKYTDSGSITLSVSGERNEEKVILHFSVKDTGIGIKEEDKDRLFSDYERINEMRNRNVEGTGLGISITARLLQLMKSELKVESTYGEGSEFFFDLSQEICDYSQIGDISARIQKKSEEFTYSSSFTAPDARVLVVDDNKMNRDVFCALLKETAVNIAQASSGRQALEMLKIDHYDIVFLDHMMPDMDGIEVIGHVRNDGDISADGTVFVALTANAISGSREMYLNAGFDDYMSKPIIPEMLENLMRRYIPEDKLLAAGCGEPISEINIGKSDDSKEELPLIQGIDWNYAYLHFSTADSLRNAIESFVSMIPIEASELESLYQRLLDNEKDEDVLKDYRIRVHAMKNEANMIGCYFLGGSAAGLEYAASKGSIRQIIEVTPFFLESWKSYTETMKVLPFMVNEADKKEISGSEDEVKGLLGELMDSMNAFDIHGADVAMKKLDEYDFSTGFDDDIVLLKGYVSNLDPDNVKIIVDRLLAHLG